MSKFEKRDLAVYFLVLLSIGITSYLGSGISGKMGRWYEATKYSITPDAWVFRLVWFVLYSLIFIWAALTWNKIKMDSTALKMIAGLYIATVILGIGWIVLFFWMHSFLLAFLSIVLLWITIIGLITVSWFYTEKISLLLVPYLIWITFAVYLSSAFTL